jgi:ParB/RepB/Spo0J family partition protein
MSKHLKEIPLKQIRENPVALRGVNRQTEQYQGLLESVKSKGVINPIAVREVKDATTGEMFYGIIEGLHRYTASLDAGKETIPAQVLNMNDAEVQEAQIIGNIHKIETKPVEYSKALQRLLGQNPLMTFHELAGKLHKSDTWLKERLGLTKLNGKIAELVDSGKINLSNAYVLAKLPEDEQPAFVDRAMQMTPQEFGGTVQARKKELDTARRQGRQAQAEGFVAVARARKTAEIKTELESPQFGPQLVRETGAKTAEEGFKLGLQFCVHLDSRSIEAAQAKDAARKKAAEVERTNAASERAARKAQEAAAEVAKLQGVPATV